MAVASATMTILSQAAAAVSVVEIVMVPLVKPEVLMTAMALVEPQDKDTVVMIARLQDSVAVAVAVVVATVTTVLLDLEDEDMETMTSHLAAKPVVVLVESVEEDLVVTTIPPLVADALEADLVVSRAELPFSLSFSFCLTHTCVV